MDENVSSYGPVLLVTAISGAENLAKALSENAGVVIELVRSRRAALAVLRRSQYAAVLVDASLPDNEVTRTDMLWQNGIGSIPLEIDLKAIGSGSLARLLRNMLENRKGLEAVVREDVTRVIVEDLRTHVTGLLLHSELALKEKAIPPAVEQRVREVHALADSLRVRLRPA